MIPQSWSREYSIGVLCLLKTALLPLCYEVRYEKNLGIYNTCEGRQGKGLLTVV